MEAFRALCPILSTTEKATRPGRCDSASRTCRRCSPKARNPSATGRPDSAGPSRKSCGGNSRPPNSAPCSPDLSVRHLEVLAPPPQTPDEKAVGPGRGRGQAEARTETRRILGQTRQIRRARKIGRRDRHEIRPIFQKMRDPVLVLLPQQRAGGINDPAAWFHKFCCFF